MKLQGSGAWRRRRQWHPTPVLLPGESHGRRSRWAAVHGVPKSWTQLSDFTFTFHFHAWRRRRKWQPTPVFLPGESQGLGSLVGCHLWGSHRVGHDWSDLAATVAGAWRNAAALWPFSAIATFKVCLWLSRVWFFATLWTVACQAPVSMGFPRQEYRLQGTNSEEPPDCSGEKSRRQSTCQSQTWRRPGPEGVDLGVSLLHVWVKFWELVSLPKESTGWAGRRSLGLQGCTVSQIRRGRWPQGQDTNNQESGVGEAKEAGVWVATGVSCSGGLAHNRSPCPCRVLGARDPAEGRARCCAGPQVVEQVPSRRGQGLAGEFVAESGP